MRTPDQIESQWERLMMPAEGSVNPERGQAIFVIARADHALRYGEDEDGVWGRDLAR